MQGMSGSPVYIDGKLIGAVALAFPYAKDPIAGIRPIEEMLQVDSRRRHRRGARRTPPVRIAMLPAREAARLRRHPHDRSRDAALAQRFHFERNRAVRAADAQAGARTAPGDLHRRRARRPHGRPFEAAARLHDQRRIDDRRHERRRRRHASPRSMATRSTRSATAFSPWAPPICRSPARK